MKNVIIFGPPGSGKGTQSQYIVAQYSFLHLSTGDLLRAEIEKKTELGLQAKKLMDQGSLVPDEVVIEMIRNKISNAKCPGVLFDGFPRTLNQAKALDEMLDKMGQKIDLMFALIVEEEELTQRLIKRGVDSGRSDDQSLDVVKKRIQEYNLKTKQVAQHYEQKKVFFEINGMGKIQEISQRIKKKLDSLT